MKYVKSLDSLLNESKKTGEDALSKTFTGWQLILLGVGAIVGAGLFSVTGIVAAQHAGPAITISFIIAAIACAFAGLCYAEFASMIPVAGSAYTYAYATMGEIVAWIIGWTLILEYALGAAAVSSSWSGYLNKLLHQFGVSFPQELLASPFDNPDAIVNLPAIIVVIILSLILIKGTKESKSLNNLLVFIKVAVVIIFIALGWSFINEANYTPYIPENEGPGKFGWSGILAGASMVFFAFIGFDAVSTAAQETKNPAKDMPIGILGSLIVCTILYVLFGHVMTGMINYKELGTSAPVATAFAMTGYDSMQTGLIIAILTGYTSVILVLLMGQSRIFYTMSKDGLIPKFFGEVHHKFHTPWKSNLFFMVFIALLAGFVPMAELGHMVSIGTLFAFTVVCLGVMVTRKTLPNAVRGFKVPFGPYIIPGLGVLTCLFLMIGLPGLAWISFVVWLIIGLIIYNIYGKKYSVIRNSTENK